MEQTDILIKPIISEKSLSQAGFNWYTFSVKPKSSKPEIKKAIEEMFSVKVLAIKTMNIKGKVRRVGRKQRPTLTSSWKKAMVLLPKEQKIDLFEAPSSASPGGISPATKAIADKSGGKNE